MTPTKLVLLGGAIAVLGACSGSPSSDNTTAAAAASPAPSASRVRGVLQTIGADTLGIQTYAGASVNAPIDAKTGFAWVVKSDLASLKNGDFIGTATTGPDDALRAVEVVIFPEAMRGTGEGHYAWDTPGAIAAAGGGGSGQSAMTNGTVQQSAMTNGTVQQQSAMTNGTVQQSAMTNGTVTGGAGKSGETKLTIGYKGGTAQVVVPVGTPIVRFEPAQRSVLTKGQKVFVVTPPDATAAKFVAIGKDGITPPM